jgi:carboxylesterase type B
MSKKPVQTGKYKEVKKQINTGKTVKDVEVMSDQFLSKRKNELFKRLRPTTIIKLLSENNNTESIYNLANECEDDDFPMDNASVTARTDNQSTKSYRTDVTSKSAITAVTYATEMLGNLVTNFLIY